jgi:carboxymethylenebutenolidase
VSVTTRVESVPVEGGSMPAHLAVPESGSGPGLVLFQEIFGANRHMRGRARTLAEWGYVTLLPDLFWRVGPGIEIDESDADAMQRAMATMGRFDMEAAVADGVRALTHLRGLPEARDGGVLGYCLGGMIAYLVASAADPAVAVCYYPSGSHERLDAAAGIACPALFHFGAADEYLPHDLPDRMREATAANPAVEIRVHPGAGHAFDNDEAPQFHHAPARARAAEQTREFLRRALPPA